MSHLTEHIEIEGEKKCSRQSKRLRVIPSRGFPEYHLLDNIMDLM